MATISDCVEYWLRGIGIPGSLTITRELEDRVYGWPTDGRLFAYCLENMRVVELPEMVEILHGYGLGFREPARPSAQVIFHPHHDRPFVQVDFDLFPPIGLAAALHAAEVLWNWIRRKKTDPNAVMRGLKRRFGGRLQ